MATRPHALTIALFFLLSGTACTEYELACEPETFPSAPGVSGLSKCAANWEKSRRDGFAKGRYELRLLNNDGTRVVMLYLPLDKGSGPVTITSESDAADRPETGWIFSGANDLSNAAQYRSTTESGEIEVSIDGNLPTDSSDGDATIEVSFGNPGVALSGDSGVARLAGTARVRATAIPVGGVAGDGCKPCEPYAKGLTDACASGSEFSFDCYCTSAHMNQCMAKAPGCSTDVVAAEAEADRMQNAANDVGSGCDKNDY